MKIRDVGLETSVSDSVQTNKMINKCLKMLAQRYQKKMLKCNKITSLDFCYILTSFFYIVVLTF